MDASALKAAVDAVQHDAERPTTLEAGGRLFLLQPGARKYEDVTPKRPGKAFNFGTCSDLAEWLGNELKVSPDAMPLVLVSQDGITAYVDTEDKVYRDVGKVPFFEDDAPHDHNMQYQDLCGWLDQMRGRIVNEEQVRMALATFGLKTSTEATVQDDGLSVTVAGKGGSKITAGMPTAAKVAKEIKVRHRYGVRDFETEVTYLLRVGVEEDSLVFQLAEHNLCGAMDRFMDYALETLQASLGSEVGVYRGA